MTTARMDSVLGCMVYPVVLTFGDQPPQEIGVVRAAMGPEQAIAELAGVLRDAAEIMVVGGDEAIRLARIRDAELQGGLGDVVLEVVDYSGCGPECGCQTGRPIRNPALDPAVLRHDQEVLGRLAVEITGHAIAEARLPLTTAEAAALGGPRLVAHVEDEQEMIVSRGQLRGHCAHDIPLSSPCTMCDRV